jgi:hypothetical protein
MSHVLIIRKPAFFGLETLEKPVWRWETSLSESPGGLNRIQGLAGIVPVSQ